MGLHARIAAAGPRPDRAQPRSRLPAFPAARARRDQAHRQRSVHVRTGRQPMHRPDPRAVELLGRRRRDGRLQPGRRRRLGTLELDDQRRSGLRRVGNGCLALRRLGDDGLHQRQGARELFAALPHSLPQRRAAGRATVANDAGVRPYESEERGVRRRLRARISAVVRARGHGAGRGGHLSPPEFARAGGQRMPYGAQQRGVARDIDVLAL